MNEAIRLEIEALQTLKTKALQGRYRELFGEPSPSSNHAHLLRRVAWRLQANATGGLSQEAQVRAAELAVDADGRLRAPRRFWHQLDGQGHAGMNLPRDRRLPPAGTELTRTYQGRLLKVTVLEQEFNSLHAQREAAEAYIQSQRHAGWVPLPRRYDDGGFSGASMERPALRQLLADVETGKVDCVVVYKVDRLSRSLLDFSRLIELFDRFRVSFVSVTQEFNTTTSLGRLTLNILLSFAQFEREIIGERTRDKLGAARRKGRWIGGTPVLGYNVDPQGGRLIVNEAEAERVRHLFRIAAEAGSLQATLQAVQAQGVTTKQWTSRAGRHDRSAK